MEPTGVQHGRRVVKAFSDDRLGSAPNGTVRYGQHHETTRERNDRFVPRVVRHAWKESGTGRVSLPQPSNDPHSAAGPKHSGGELPAQASRSHNGDLHAPMLQ